MCADLVLSADLLKCSEDIPYGKLDGKIFFFNENSYIYGIKNCLKHNCDI